MARPKNVGDRKCYMYRVVNLNDGNDYIGVSIDPKRRWRDHKKDAKNGSELHFHRALRLYNPEAFEWKIIAIYRNEDIAREMETIAREYFKFGYYNMTPGGDGITRHLPETIEKIRQSTTEVMNRPEMKARMSTQSKEMWNDPIMRDRIIASMTELWSDPERRQKSSEQKKAFFAANPDLCALYTEARTKALNEPDVKARMCASQQARWTNPEAHIKHSATITAALAKPEAKANMSAAQQARFARTGGDSDETKAKKSAAQIARFQKPEERQKNADCRKKSANEPKNIATMSRIMSARWADPEQAAAMSEESARRMNTPEAKKEKSELFKKMWSDPVKAAEITAKRMASRAANKEAKRLQQEADKAAVDLIKVHQPRINLLRNLPDK